MSTPEVDQAEPLLLSDNDIERQNDRQVINSFKQLKSFDIMKSSLKILASNTKLMLLMVISIIPFIVFMVFFELKLQKTIVAAQDVFRYPRPIIISVSYADGRDGSNGSRNLRKVTEIVHDYDKVDFLFDVLQLCLLYLVLYPSLELLSMSTIIPITAKVYAGEKPVTLKEVFCSKINFKGVLTMCGYVHLLSSLTFLGLVWVFVNHMVFTRSLSPLRYSPDVSLGVYIFSLGIHGMIFIVLAYNYIHWGAFWNMAMVISVLEEEGGLDAFGMTNYYGKHCKPTGFQLMLGFVGFNILLRLPCLIGAFSKWNVAGFTSVVIGLVCLGNLVKWVAFVLYYFNCKEQTMGKKNDEEIGKAVNVG